MAGVNAGRRTGEMTTGSGCGNMRHGSSLRMPPKDGAETTMMTRAVGAAGPTVGAPGLGCMGMSEFYGMGHNELPIREALRGRWRDSVVLSVKFGAQRDVSGAFPGFDGGPARAMMRTAWRCPTASGAEAVQRAPTSASMSCASRCAASCSIV